MGTRSTGRMTAAHSNKSVMALDWKESVDGDGNTGNGGWLASAGLDKTVKVRSEYFRHTEIHMLNHL